MAKEIDVMSLRKRIDAGEDFLLVDVREPFEYEEFNIGAKLIPLAEVPSRIEEFGAQDRPIVVHCRSGKRSAQAQAYLMSQGYTDVTNLSGGMLAWQDTFGAE